MEIYSDEITLWLEKSQIEKKLLEVKWEKMFMKR